MQLINLGFLFISWKMCSSDWSCDCLCGENFQNFIGIHAKERQ